VLASMCRAARLSGREVRNLAAVPRRGKAELPSAGGLGRARRRYGVDAARAPRHSEAMGAPLHIIDAFARGPLTGNPAAVCLLSEPPSEAAMQRVAAEMNLSETAF